MKFVSRSEKYKEVIYMLDVIIYVGGAILAACAIAVIIHFIIPMDEALKV